MFQAYTEPTGFVATGLERASFRFPRIGFVICETWCIESFLHVDCKLETLSLPLRKGSHCAKILRVSCTGLHKVEWPINERGHPCYNQSWMMIVNHERWMFTRRARALLILHHTLFKMVYGWTWHRLVCLQVASFSSCDIWRLFMAVLRCMSCVVVSPSLRSVPTFLRNHESKNDKNALQIAAYKISFASTIIVKFSGLGLALKLRFRPLWPRSSFVFLHFTLLLQSLTQNLLLSPYDFHCFRVARPGSPGDLQHYPKRWWRVAEYCNWLVSELYVQKLWFVEPVMVYNQWFDLCEYGLEASTT
jgi:hypothetical protein